MKQVSTILTNATVVTMDSDYRVIEKGAVVVDRDEICGIGTADETRQAYASDNTIDCTGHAIVPGLINAHTHAAMTLLRGLADDRRLDVWLIGYMMPTEREFVNPEFVYLGTQLACAEMILSGITTFNDMYYFEESAAQAASDAGMRALCGQTILKFPSPDAESYVQGLDRCRKLIQKWRGHPLVIPTVAPHAPYTCTAEMLRACAQLALEFDVPIHIHISETAGEVAESRKEHGMPVVPWIKKQDLLDAKVIAAHCVHLDEGELRTLLHYKTGISHNPTSNLKLASGIAPVQQMLRLGLSVGIGTDGPASNNDLDMFEETRLAALIAKVATDNPTTLPAREAFAMATRLGAKALHIDHLTGSLEVGKRADIAVVSLENLHNSPRFERDPDSVYSQIVYSAKSTDVQHVMCNGIMLLRDRKLLSVNPVPLLMEAQMIARKIDRFLSIREGDTLSKLLAIGELQREESFEIQVKALLEEPEQIHSLLDSPEVEIIRQSHYLQHDTYFELNGQESTRVRYREDEPLDTLGSATTVRTRLTLTESKETREFTGAVILSRSRFISPATRTLRFYREYFRPISERTIVKERRRWHIDFRGTRFYVNLDQLREPARAGYYLEIKSQTWSLKDAEEKAAAILELLGMLGIEQSSTLHEEYWALVDQS